MTYQSDHSSFGSSGSSSSSHGAGKDTKIDATKLADTLIADGRLFGVKMPQETIDGIRKVIPAILYMLTDKGQDLATQKWGAQKGKYVGIGIALLEQIAETVQNLYDLVTSLDSLNKTMRPALKAGGTSDNEAIEDLRGKIISMSLHRFMNTIVGAIGALPSLLLAFSKTDKKMHGYETLKELEAAKGNPEEVAKILKSQYHGGGKGGVNKGITGEQLAAGQKKLIEGELATYVNEYAEFKKLNEAKMKTTLTTAVRELNDVDYEAQLIQLRKMGMPVDTLTKEINELKNMNPDTRLNMRRRRTGDPRAAAVDLSVDIGEKVEAFKATYLRGKNLDPYVETALKKQFVRDKGVFNNSWKEYADEDVKKNKTQEEEFKEFFRKQSEDHLKLQKEADEAVKKVESDSKLKQLWDTGPALIAGFVRDFVVQLVGGKSLEKLKKPVAAELVSHLAKSLTPPPGSPSNWTPPKEVPPLADKAGKGKGDGELAKSLGYTRYIHDIFNMQQAYHGRAGISDLLTPHFNKVQWDKDGAKADEEIRKMNDDELTPYEYALKHIMIRVVDGKLPVAAVLNFIGDKHGNRIVQSDGQVGPAGAGKDDKDIKVSVMKIIDDHTTMMRTDQSITKEQLSEKMANWVFKVDDFKRDMESKDIDAQWRHFTFKLFSDAVGSDARVCEMLSIRNERCHELRKAATEFNDKLDGMIHVLARKLEEDPKNFSSILTDKDKKLIAELDGRRKKQGGHVADTTKGREESAALMSLALNASMTLGKQAEFQQDLGMVIEEIKKPREEATKETTKEHSSKEAAATAEYSRLKPEEVKPAASRPAPNGHDAAGHDKDIAPVHDRVRDVANGHDKAAPHHHKPSDADRDLRDPMENTHDKEFSHRDKLAANNGGKPHRDPINEAIRKNAEKKNPDHRIENRPDASPRNIENRTKDGYSKLVQHDKAETAEHGRLS